MTTTTHPTFTPFHFEAWIERHRDLLKPPVGNKLVFEEAGMVVMVVGGPNGRVDFHDDPVQEFFYQLKGDMVLKVAEGGEIYDVPIREARSSCFRPTRGTRRSARSRARSVWSSSRPACRGWWTASSGSASSAGASSTGWRWRSTTS